MTTTPESIKADPESGRYEIRIKGHLSPHRADSFEGLTIALDASGETLLTGLIDDQAALHGLLRKIRDLGLPLVSVNRIEPDQTDEPNNNRLNEPQSFKRETTP